MIVRIESGYALVLLGPPASGKTTLARTLANDVGSYTELRPRDLESEFWAQNITTVNPSSCIIDGFPTGKNVMERLKSIISNPTMIIDRKYRSQVTVPSPNLIFCVTHLDPNLYLNDPRRFRVVRMGDHP